MSDVLGIGLQITVIGMGLVFAVIILLWGGMFALVRLMDDRAPSEAAEAEAEAAAQERAAAAAVAIALAQARNDKPHPFPEPPTALVSAWQAVMRANQLNQRGPRR
jgi:Na+-transporting methylmalonyl-CoA/oxaloacetate decarboxylase gamma subunit